MKRLAMIEQCAVSVILAVSELAIRSQKRYL